MTTSEWIAVAAILVPVSGALILVLVKLDSASINAKNGLKAIARLQRETSANREKLVEHSVRISHLERVSEKYDTRFARLEDRG